MLLEESNPVATENECDVAGRIAAGGENRAELLQIGKRRDGNGRSRRRRARTLCRPFRRQHPIVAGNANYTTSARNHDLELLVGKLPSARHQRTTILMARQHRTVKRVDHLLERKIAQMGEVENHAQPLELGEQFAPAGGQRRLTGVSGNYNGNASSIRRTTSCGGTPTARPRQVWPRMVTTMAL